MKFPKDLLKRLRNPASAKNAGNREPIRSPVGPVNTPENDDPIQSTISVPKVPIGSKGKVGSIITAPQINAENGASFGHKSVFEADPFSHKTQYRRQAIFLKLFVVAFTASVLGNIVLVSSISSLLPLKTTELALLRVDPNDDRIYQVEPVSVEVPGYEVMVEKIARRYVRDILAIDNVTQNTRFERIRRYSDSEFFNQYIKDNKDLVSRALKDGLNRSITVEGANKIIRYDDIYQFVVEFTQTDKIGRDKPKSRSLRAYLELAPRPNDVKEVDKFENPLGIRVLSMAVKEQPTKK
ncbi:type IV secretion system protein [Cohaesibacter celericrescens]|uniref:Bacterial virulence protein VirB8 domain-containing protein n=1 Tax=Cohaesibacter celericrescens TaxID=2067669 RepID=A0A2N5XRV1_9HYPH|nr:type IV secretion system protein [Cohaesibacter celericrescens]PLW77185.1 hypothetical protein C0081_10960 [Cohaesibacter celericrescens]